MNTLIVILMGIIIFLLLIIIIAGIFVAYQYTKNINTKFEIQMKMAEAQSNMSNPLKFEDLTKIINDIVLREVVSEVNSGRYTRMKSEELSLVMNDTLSRIATAVHSDLGPDVIRQWNKFSNSDYLARFILEMVRTAFILKVENERAKHPLPQQTMNFNQKQKTNKK